MSKIEEKIEKYLGEKEQRLFDRKGREKEKAIKFVENNIEAPYVVGMDYTIGSGQYGEYGIDIDISLDSKDEWEKGILYNSRYLKIRLDSDISKDNLKVKEKRNIKKKFKDTNAKTLKEAVKEINKYLKEVK